MKLEVTLCYSIIEYCLKNADPFQRNNDAIKVLDEIKRRKVIINSELEEYWRSYFEENNPNLLNTYMTFYSNFILYEDGCLITDDYANHPQTNQLFPSNEEYKKLIYNICYSSKDRILFTELMKDLINSPNCEVDVYDVGRILNDTEDNLLNNYRLPITNKQISLGTDSRQLADWLKKFLEGEKEIAICDNHLFEERASLLDYVLCHLPVGAKVVIHTMIPSNWTESSMQAELRKPPFSQWQFELNIIPTKKEHHSREIVTSKYLINLDKGIGSFGKQGKTHQSVININYITTPFTPPHSRKI